MKKLTSVELQPRDLIRLILQGALDLGGPPAGSQMEAGGPGCFPESARHWPQAIPLEEAYFWTSCSLQWGATAGDGCSCEVPSKWGGTSYPAESALQTRVFLPHKLMWIFGFS